MIKKNDNLILYIMIILMGLFNSCLSNKNAPATVNNVDLEKYAGKWYEIAAFPTKFQKGCSCSSAEYSLNSKGYVDVLNSCYKNNEASSIKGKAFIVKGSNNSKLKVQFFWPFKGDYWIIELADDYSWVAVGSPKRNFLWIMSRTKTMDETLYKQINQKLINKGFDVYKLVKTRQDCK